MNIPPNLSQVSMQHVPDHEIKQIAKLLRLLQLLGKFFAAYDLFNSENAVNEDDYALHVHANITILTLQFVVHDQVY